MNKPFSINYWLLHSLRICLQKAVIDNPTFARIFTINETYWLFSSKLLESSVRKDIVVNDPQNPIAAKRKYFSSRFHCCESTMNNP